MRKDRDRLEKLAVAANAAIVLMGLLGLLLSGRFKLSFLWFYTVLSNLLLMITSALYLLPQIRKKHPRAAGVMRYSATVSTSLTFVIVAAVFAPFGGGLRVLVEGRWLFQHLLCPLASVASFIFFEREELKKTDLIPAIAPTVVYAAVLVASNLAHAIEGPYPFFRVYGQPWYISVLWCIGILGGTAAMAEGLMKLRSRGGVSVD